MVFQPFISQAAYIPSGDKVHLDFDAEHATSFKVLRQGPGQTALTVIASKVEATSYDDEDVETGSYTYQVIGHNSGGDGPPSATVTVTVAVT